MRSCVALWITNLLLSTATGTTPSAVLPRHDTEKRSGLDLFKGQSIPEINWMSSDTQNFTWGLTGVDNVENLMFSTYLYITLTALLSCLLLYRIYNAQFQQLRLATTVSNHHYDPAHYLFSLPQRKRITEIQKHLFLAPLFKLRHNTPYVFSLSRFPGVSFHLGSLPSRMNFILLVLYIVSNTLYCTLYLPWSGHVGPDGKLQEPTKAALVAEFRGRTGVMAVVNCVPLFMCMMRNNWIGDAVKVKFDTWNLFHRWSGRIVVLESLLHMGAWITNEIDHSGRAGMNEAFRNGRFLQFGLLAEVALVLIAVLSVSPLRHRHYEFFLMSHQALIICFLVGSWWHLVTDSLPQLTYINICIAIWCIERGMRVFWVLKRNFKFRRNGIMVGIAEIECVGEDAVKLSVDLGSRGWDFIPGQHSYIYIPRIGYWQCHPFSVAWSTETSGVVEMIPLLKNDNSPYPEHGISSRSDKSEDNKMQDSSITVTTIDTPMNGSSLDMSAPDSPTNSSNTDGISFFPNSTDSINAARHPTPTHSDLDTVRTGPFNQRFFNRRQSSIIPPQHREIVAKTPKKTRMHFIISKNGGFTKKLYHAAKAASRDTEKGGTLRLMAFLEGPYGGHHSYDSYGTVLLIAGGVGITHCIGYVRHLLHGYGVGTVATHKCKLIWVVRSREHVNWAREWLEEIARMDRSSEFLTVDIYVTRPSPGVEQSPFVNAPFVQWNAGRPDFHTVVGKAVSGRVGALAVNVCGGGSLSDTVRAATRVFLDDARIDFTEESFNW